ncbi:MAG: cofactor assembly of complex C subunit B [Cyanobacteria bacterium J06627_32]
MLSNDPTRVSTLLLTSLMVIGLVFFIRASTKDRIEVAQFGSMQPTEPLQQDVMTYFQARAYRPVRRETVATEQSATEEAPASVTVAGLVSPSIFMAVFLSGLAGVGLACLALILLTLFASLGGGIFGLVAIAPLAGIFYWRKSSRPEAVTFKVAPASQPDGEFVSTLTVKGHRDEIAELQNALASVLEAL